MQPVLTESKIMTSTTILCLSAAGERSRPNQVSVASYSAAMETGVMDPFPLPRLPEDCHPATDSWKGIKVLVVVSGATKRPNGFSFTGSVQRTGTLL
mmetsp:Transcript_24184/g.51825  ORF Transcript_24184/g.51825 Transcript_24184/m.51825 type:complete len:97 (+) Transcript_24184:1375-1665(+)